MARRIVRFRHYSFPLGQIFALEYRKLNIIFAACRSASVFFHSCVIIVDLALYYIILWSPIISDAGSDSCPLYRGRP
jgi:hypothetical protein